jgi:hypothetical protein
MKQNECCKNECCNGWRYKLDTLRGQRTLEHEKLERWLTTALDAVIVDMPSVAMERIEACLDIIREVSC